LKKQVRDFKGIWIPREIWLNENLSLQEKAFIVEIDSLDKENGCFASNQYFSEFFNVSRSRCTQVIKSLEEKGFIKVELQRKGNSITKRIINVIGGKYPKQGGKNTKQGGKYPKYASLESSEYNNTSSLNNTISNTSNKNTSDKPDYISLFNEFWKLYPKKVDKKKSQDKYIKLMTNNKSLHLMIIIELNKQIDWRKNADQKTFIPEWKNPTTWINGECWNDELGKITSTDKQSAVDEIKRNKLC